MQSTTPPAVDYPTGKRNLETLWESLEDWERAYGINYYNFQYDRILSVAYKLGLSVFNKYGGYRKGVKDDISDRALAAVFAVLSPNNHENTNYTALDQCLKIWCGLLPETAKVPAYGANKVKALRMLREYSAVILAGGKPLDYDPWERLTGQKVKSFYHNTIWPNANTYTTIDGHMKSAWLGRRVGLKHREANVSPALYLEISRAICELADKYETPAPGFQAGLWIGWRHHIAAPGQYWLQLW